MRFFRLIVLFGLLGLATHLAAQPPHSFTRYGRENNFSGTTVEDMAQDSHGQLWLATWGGLYSFDGRTFRNYLTDNPEDRDNPRSNHFVDVEALDNDEILVLSYDNRLYRLNPDSRKLDPVNEGGDDIQAMFRIRGDELYFLTTSNELLDASFSRSCLIRRDATVHSVIDRPGGVIWILTDRGIYRNDVLLTDMPAFCSWTADDVLYIGSANGQLLLLENEQLSTIPTRLGTNITFIAPVPGRPELLLGSDHRGIEAFNLDDGTQRSVVREEKNAEERNYSSRMDENGNLWVFPQQGSLYWYNRDTHQLFPFLGSDNRQGWNSETGITSFLVWPNLPGEQRPRPSAGPFRLDLCRHARRPPACLRRDPAGAGFLATGPPGILHYAQPRRQPVAGYAWRRPDGDEHPGQRTTPPQPDPLSQGRALLRAGQQ